MVNSSLYGFVSQGLGTTKFTNLIGEIDIESDLDFPISTGVYTCYILR